MKNPLNVILLIIALLAISPIYGQWEFEFALPAGDQEVGDLIFSAEGIVYAGLDDGIYQRSDDMPDWTLANFPSITSLATDLAFLEPELYFLVRNETLEKSTDGGLSWEYLIPNPGYFETMVYLLPICDDKILLVGETIYVSSDDGNSWEYFGIGGTFWDRSVISYEGGILYQGGGNYNRYSLDCGDTWINVSDNLDAVVTGPSESINTSFIANGRLFAEVGKYVEHSNELYISTDTGATWSYAHDGLPTFDENDQLFFLEAVGPFFLAGIEDKGVFISYDGGFTWQDFNDGLGSLEINNSAFTHDGTWIYLGTEDGIFKRPLSDLGLATATGLVFLDENANGQQDTGEPGLPQHILRINGLNQYTITDPTGTFQVADGFLDPVQIEAFPVSPYAVMTPNPLQINTPLDTAKIAVSFPGNEEDLSIDLTKSIPSRPGFQTQIFIQVHNRGAVVQDAIVSLTYDANMNYLSATPAPTSANGNTLSWEFNQLDLLSSELIEIDFLLPSDVPLGTLLEHNATVLPDANDETPSDNITTIEEIAVGSFDPNDKQVSQEILTPDEVSQEQALAYTIRFQNTGTFPAEFVRIEDTLDTNLDITSLRVLSSSHPYELSIDSARTIQFLFNDIQLPDSTSNEPESHGFIKYSIQAHPDTEIGTTIENTASIFFDFNEPVITNTVQTVVALPVSGKDVHWDINNKLLAIPNPSAGTIQLQIEGDIQLNNALLFVYNSTGQLVWEDTFKPELELGHLPAGTYRLLVLDLKLGRFITAIVIH
ncbi:MAG: hypothetical protein GYB31_03980 [Bacteroidetes bacterium]|nr:hypothetical protein [Bacteroidota bacterium]